MHDCKRLLISGLQIQRTVEVPKKL